MYLIVDMLKHTAANSLLEKCWHFLLDEFIAVQEVAVKRFLDQDISGESLEEFKSEVLAVLLFSYVNIMFVLNSVEVS